MIRDDDDLDYFGKASMPTARIVQLGSRKPKVGMKLFRSSKGAILPHLSNIVAILEQDPEWIGVFKYNTLSQTVMLMKRPPYEVANGPWIPRPAEDTDDSETSASLFETYQLSMATGTICEATNMVAKRNAFNPLEDYLNSLKWDGLPRIDFWPETYFSTPATTYTRVVASKTLIAAVARALNPGCQVDTVTILAGGQGIGKSSFWRALAGPEYFSDVMPDLHSKDSMDALKGNWMIEFAELSALKRSDMEAAKRFITCPVDHYRPAYGRKTITSPRRCVFVGSTNQFEFLHDQTGNRRYWPLDTPERCNLYSVIADRDQLWAEAVYRYRQGERWHLNADQEALANVCREEKLSADPWEPIISDYLIACCQDGKASSRELVESALGISAKEKWTQGIPSRIAGIMSRLGWERKLFDDHGVKTRGYKKLVTHPLM
jgi:putative DNA primase/helicase